MRYVSLLFTSENNYQEWNDFDHSEIRPLQKDLNIDDITLFLNGAQDDFPGIYIRKPCLQEKDANFRIEIMRELLNDVDLYNRTTELIVMMQKIKSEFKTNTEIKNEHQKHWHFLSFLKKYFESIYFCRDSFRCAQSSGLIGLYHFCDDLINVEFYSSILENVDRLLLEVSGFISDSGISIDQSGKIISLIKCDTDINESDQLQSMINEVFGITIKNDFSIVNPSPLSALESRMLEKFVSWQPDIFVKIAELYKCFIDIEQIFIKYIELIPQLIFYKKYISMLQKLKNENIPVCAPVFIPNEYFCNDCVNFSLALKHIQNKTETDALVKNNIRLPKGKSFILSGPNQGGKTTYLKMLGLNAYLAKCGCYVTGSTCNLMFYDKIYSHFPRMELLGKGRLNDEIDRMENIANQISDESLVLWNESFTSTRRKEGVELAVHYLSIFNEVGCSLGFVSHFYEIPKHFEKDVIISLISMIGNESERTYKIVETSGDGMAYARDIADYCGVTYEKLCEIIKNAKTRNSEKTGA
ncbi:MAG: MutS-related protein [Saccharofermentanales bacterium]